MSSTRAIRYGCSAIAALALVAFAATPAAAQGAAAPTPKVVVTGGVDFTNQYNFRGIRQNTRGMATQPWLNVHVNAAEGSGAVKSVGVDLGSWNSLHSKDNSPTFESGGWYETDYIASLGLGFAGGVSLATTYTSYTSPNDSFAHVKEIMEKLSVTNTLNPYAIVAFELSDDGQADAGASKGTYVELGVGPAYAGSKASVAFPIKVGLSANDYYEFGTGSDSKFGYFSIAGIVTVPAGAHWNVHGGLELQAYGDNLKAYNAFGDSGDRSTAGILSFGLGFSY
jgi:hypothetical protein